jgi:hypothetical protein
MRTIGLIAAFFLTAGCSDASLVQLPDGERGYVTDDDDDASSDDDDASDDDDGAPYDEGDDDDASPDDDDATADGPPADRISECPPDAVQIVDFHGPSGEDEIYVLAWNNTTASATLEAPLAGLYDLYDTSVAESGASQTNETGFIRVSNDHNPDGAPVWANCGDDWIVPDSDNAGPPPAAWSYLGTFDLNEGANALTLHHWCPVYRTGNCAWFHVGDPDGPSGCNDDGPNSIHLNVDGFCMIPRRP